MNNDTVKKIRLLTTLLIFLAATPARAQEQKPQLTEPGYIAMIFYKMTREIPPFETWARLSEDYINAYELNKPSIATARAEDLKNTFNFMTIHETITVEMPVIISAYSKANRGFFVDNFKDDTFFPITYDGRDYGVVPQSIPDKQWMSMPDDAQANAVEAAAQANEGRMLNMVLSLTPIFADKAEPMYIKKKQYWILLTEVKTLKLYNPKDNALLWQSEVAGANDKKQQELLNLYQ